MNRIYILIFFLQASFISTYGQTIDDVKKLGLSESQLMTSFEKRQIILTNNSTGKKKKLKEGAFAKIIMKGDTTKMEVILEAFLTDSIIVSSLTTQLSGKEIKHKWTNFKLLPLKNIESIEYSVRHIKGTYWASFLMTLTGLEMAVLPVIMPPIIGNTDEVYSQTQFPFIVAGGIILFILGKKVQKKLIPKEYNLNDDWNYRVMKK